MNYLRKHKVPPPIQGDQPMNVAMQMYNKLGVPKQAAVQDKNVRKFLLELQDRWGLMPDSSQIKGMMKKANAGKEVSIEKTIELIVILHKRIFQHWEEIVKKFK